MQDILKEGRNYWRRDRADFAAVIVDYGNYYRDLRESMLKAEKSIFVLGWDIDSRIELLRGHDAEEADGPVTFFDVICHKAQENPFLQVYLNKWDYSYFFMRQREPFWGQKWGGCDLPNVHYCLDDVLPLAACHHQKVVVIDDEIAYWGGMDVALGRWDFREHHIVNDYRADPGQLPNPHHHDHFDPYHDIQAVAAGPIVDSFAQLVRERWKIACGTTETVPFTPRLERTLPKTWPDSDPPDFENVDMAIARTLPKMGKRPQVEEVYHLLLDEIAQAESFIYMENQFLACDDIARAINNRLRERPALRVLIVSSFNPQGIMEKRAMWGGRVRFRDILESNGMAERVAITYPVCRENDDEAAVRIHSKLMIIDDRYLHIGSANINCRSMGMDTECDGLIIGGDAASRRNIEAVRNDLIREHTGHDLDYIQSVIAEGDPLHRVLQVRPESRQHLRHVNDEQYRRQSFMKLATKMADPRRPMIPAGMTRLPRLLKVGGMKGRVFWMLAGALAFIAAASLLWSHTPLSEYTDTEKLTALMEQARQSPFAILWITAIYVVGGLVFFPVTALSGAVIIVFGGLKGFIFSLVGALASGTVGYMIGYALGKDRLRRHFPKAGKVMDKVKNSGVIGVAVIRTLPIAPFSLMNMVMGVAHVTMPAFIMGTILGLAPGKIMLAIFGESITDVFKNPDAHNIMLAALGLAGWLAVVLACNKLARMWQDRQQQMA